ARARARTRPAPARRSSRLTRPRAASHDRGPRSRKDPRMPYCEHCGVEGGGDYCPSCGQVRSFAAMAVAAGQGHTASGTPPGPAARPAVATALSPVGERAVVVQAASPHHSVPAILSFFIPGLGQLTKGHVLKGLATWGALGLAAFGGFF